MNIIEKELDCSAITNSDLSKFIRDFFIENESKDVVSIQMLNISKEDAASYSLKYSSNYSYSLYPIRNRDNSIIGYKLQFSKRI